MSAIFGILRFDGQAASAAEVERMGATMPYRSPDRRKIEMLGPVGLGHGLMRVTHEDWNDAQPLRDKAADLALVADVRLDNREDLAETLGIVPETLRDMADSALILAAYERWGEGLVDHLLGDFAFAIWDGAAQKLVLVRDHMGQRTLFYTRQEGFFAFATDLKALWAVDGVPRRISEAAIGRRLMFIPPPAGTTPFEELFGLSGGTLAVVTPGGALALRRYWRPRAAPEHEQRDEAYYIAAYRTVLTEAVACRLRRNLKPAALLFSGGYDSTAIAGLAGQVLRPQGRKLIALSAVLAEGRDHEPANARRWVELCRRHMPHLDVRYFVRSDETVLTGLDTYFLATGFPGSDVQHVLTALFRCAASAGAQVVMDGHGGDYTLNPRGDGSLSLLLRTGRIFRFLRSAWVEARSKEASMGSIVAQALGGLAPPALVALKRRIAMRGAPPWSAAPIRADFADRLFRAGDIDPAQLRSRPRDRWRMRAGALEILERQSGAAHTGAPSLPAAQGLELTRPFHDKRVVELALAIPETLYAKDGRSRYLARRGLSDILPEAFQTRRWGGNDVVDPDSLQMIDGAREALLNEAADLAQNPTVAACIDLERVSAGLTAAGPHARRRKLMALNSLLIGRYIRWLDQSNG